MNSVIIKSLQDLKNWAQTFFAAYENERVVFLLEGPMGIGKTQLVRTVAEIRNIQGVSSPTYSIINEYADGFIHHLDLYRIEEESELQSIGFEDLFLKKQGWIFIEWPSKLNPQHLPHAWKKILITFTKGTPFLLVETRVITVEFINKK